MKLPTVPTVYYCPEINEIVLIEPLTEKEALKTEQPFVIKVMENIAGRHLADVMYQTKSEPPTYYKIRFDDCCHDYFEDKSYLKKNWPHLVKIGEL